MIWDYLERFNVNKEYEDVLGYILKNKLPAGKKNFGKLSIYNIFDRGEKMLKYIPRRTYTLNMIEINNSSFFRINFLNFKGDPITSTSSDFVETLRNIEDCSDIIFYYPIWTSRKYLHHVLNTNRIDYETLDVYIMLSHRIK